MSVRPEAVRRRRRRIVVLAATAGAIAVVVVALIAWSPRKAAHVRAADGPTTSTEALPDSTTVMRDSELPPTTLPGVDVRPTTTAVRRTTTTIRPSTTTTTEMQQCAAADLDGTTTTDKTSYSSGQVVTVTVRLRNHSSHTCDGRIAYFGESPVTISDANGAAVWSPPGHPPGIGIAPQPNPVPPGGSYTYATVQWDQHTCDSACAQDMRGGQEGGQVAPGTYVAHGTFSAGDSGRMSTGQAEFTVAAGG